MEKVYLNIFVTSSKYFEENVLVVDPEHNVVWPRFVCPRLAPRADIFEHIIDRHFGSFQWILLCCLSFYFKNCTQGMTLQLLYEACFRIEEITPDV